MSALTRVTHKVFGFAGTSDNFAEFGSVLAGAPVTTKDIATLMGLSAWDNGWQSAVVGANKAPVLEEMNAQMYIHSYQTGYLFQSGIPEWDAATTYFTGSVVRVGGSWYSSLQDNNLNNTPPVGGTNAMWKWVNQPGIPAGTILDYDGLSLPLGFLWPDGQFISRTDYADLFDSKTLSKAANITNGSAVVTGLDDTSLLGPGMYAEGAGIATGARILTVDGVSQVTLTLACNSTIATTVLFCATALGTGTFAKPDLRQRVTYGAGATWRPGQTGGAERVTLTALESGLPAHTHTYQWAPPTGAGGDTGATRGTTQTFATSDVVGGAQPASTSHENLPPIYVCNKILKY